jgi:DNA-binding IclR family transcriptional regulator
MVYTVLQLVTRGREQGVSTIVIGKTTGYDQKTVHYLVNKLISLDYVYVWYACGIRKNTSSNSKRRI